mgnify:CR=1 FL=1
MEDIYKDLVFTKLKEKSYTYISGNKSSLAEEIEKFFIESEDEPDNLINKENAIEINQQTKQCVQNIADRKLQEIHKKSNEEIYKDNPLFGLY